MDNARIARGRDSVLSGRDPRELQARTAGSRKTGTKDIRLPVRASWSRALDLGLRPDSALAPIRFTDDSIVDHRSRHPLAAVWPVLRQSFRWATAEPGQLLFLSDADGHLLWVEGDHATVRGAERLRLVPGALWSEQAVGTSGVGTALALRAPFQVFGAEHFLSSVTGFACTAAPIRDPETGVLLGTVDLTCGLNSSRLMALSLLNTGARLAESILAQARSTERARLRQRYLDRLTRRLGNRSAIVAPDGLLIHADPPGWLPRHLPGFDGEVREGVRTLPDGQPVIVERLVAGGPYLVLAHDTTTDEADPTIGFEALGRECATVRVDGVSHELGRRHSELVAVLLANPAGLSAEELASEVYGPAGRAMTVRGELARMRRRVLGHRLASEPYRLTGSCEADFLLLDERVAGGSTAALVASYPGPLLPTSTAPGVVAIRRRLHERLRQRVLTSGDVDVMVRWCTSRHGRDDEEAAAVLHRSTGPGSR